MHVTPATDSIDEARDWFARFEGAGLDGVMAKPVELPYVPDKRVLFKVKHHRTADCVVAGYRGGWIDTVFMRVVDVMFAFPVLLLALAIVAILGPGVTTTMLAIGVVYTPIFARVARASTLSISHQPRKSISEPAGGRTTWLA